MRNCVNVVLLIIVDMEEDEDMGLLIRERVFVWLGLLFSYYKKWNFVIRSSMYGIRDYYCRRNKLEIGSLCYYVVIGVWEVFLKRIKLNSILEKS